MPNTTLTKILICWLLGTVFFRIAAFAQVTPPIINCIEIKVDGILIYWENTQTCGAAFDAHEIWVSNSENGPFTKLTEITDAMLTSYFDKTSNPDQKWYYYMITNCNGVLSTQSAIVDTDLPQPPNLFAASVISDNIVTLTWQPNPSPETKGYVVYKEVDGVLIEYAIINDPQAVSWQDTNAEANLHPEAYRMAAFDGCNQFGPNSGTLHKTIYLTATTEDCDDDITLTWTPYQAWGTDLLEYQIIKLDTTTQPPSFEKIATVPVTQNTFVYTLANNETYACFQVDALYKDNVSEANSNTVCAGYFSANGPEYMYLTRISVNEDNDVELDWVLDTQSPNNKLQLWRANKNPNDLVKLAQIAPPLAFTPEMSTIDDGAETDIRSYYYQVRHIDECGRFDTTNIGKTIWLKGKDQFNFKNGLSWTPFALNFAQATQYTIWRKPKDGGSFTSIATLDPTVLEYDDDYNSIQGDPGQQCYRIEASYTITLPAPVNKTLTLSSFSNTVCIEPLARVYLPNTFMPNGLNSTFKPTILAAEVANYTLHIVNRWGEVVFTTTDPAEGWDGRVRNTLAPQGAYAYHLTMTTEGGRNFERQGSVLLIR